MRINRFRAVTTGSLMLVVWGCAPTPQITRPEPATPRAPDSYPRSAADRSGPAVQALLAQADTELQVGASDRAIAKLENALRIESRNPFIWQRLARAHLQEHRLDQAETLAQRSNSLGRGNPWLELENWRVIAAARHERGDAAGAAIADGKIAELQAQVER